jgi:hypothetical protein
MTVPYDPRLLTDLNKRRSLWSRLFGRPNWLGETWKAEYMRRLQAAEASVRNAHDRINELDTRMSEHTNPAKHGPFGL